MILDVYLDVTDANVDLDDGQVDAAIRYGSGRYPRTAAERMLNESVTPVCSPVYLQEMGGLSGPAELARCVLLHEDRMLANWQKWLALARAKGVRVQRRTCLQPRQHGHRSGHSRRRRGAGTQRPGRR